MVMTQSASLATTTMAKFVLVLSVMLTALLTRTTLAATPTTVPDATAAAAASTQQQQQQQSVPPSDDERMVDEDESFDYIIIGAGTSGSIVAGRLAEAGYDVLLLEAGGHTLSELGGTEYIMPDELTVFDVPSQWVDIADSERWNHYHWAVRDTPRVRLAKGLGGCSIHNAMLYMRGVLADFELWDEEWSWSHVLPYYIKSEAQQDVELASSPVHGVNGPMAVSSVHPLDRDPLAELFVKACMDAGLPYVPDFNALPRAKERCNARENHDRTGAGYYQFQIRKGQRETSARAWYGDEGMFPWRTSKKLRVLTNAHVTRIVFDTSTPPVATGVEFTLNPGTDYQQRLAVSATQEVVLSAGAINSPHLLMLSGIGPADVLRRLGIPVISDLKGVGQNLMDGSVTSMQWELPNTKYHRCTPSSDSAFCIDQQRQYYRARVGQYATPGFSAGAFFKSQPSYNRPNIQFTMHAYDKPQRLWPDGVFVGNGDGSGVMTLEIADNNPWSRGSVSLRSADPFDPPLVRCGHMTVESDIQTLIYAIKQARQVIRQSNLNGTVGRELLPGEDLTDAQLRDYVLCGPAAFRPAGVTCDADVRVANHHAGTCRMGNFSKDANAVVDAHLRVRGVSRLRVVDASIMPQLPSGNTHATCLMIGERGAAFLIATAGGSRAGWMAQMMISASHQLVLVTLLLTLLFFVAIICCHQYGATVAFTCCQHKRSSFIINDDTHASLLPTTVKSSSNGHSLDNHHNDYATFR